ncbi:MAG: carbon starvation protein A [Acidobacteria bacterium]|nr:carbon starvation protein A [Acidobacteriota bacterium]
MAALVTVLCFVIYFVGYKFYSRHLAERVFKLDPAMITPAHALEDGIDFVPTNKFVLFGHHWASITGLSPMLGPAVAVIWGWGPAMAWVVLGGLLVGCVHDFSALVISIRAKGVSIGKVTEGIIGPRAKTLFHLIIFFAIALAMGVFVYVISDLFAISDAWDPAVPLADPASFPSAVLPSAALVGIAFVMGHLLYRKQYPLGKTTAVGFVLMMLSVWAGLYWPLMGMDRAVWPSAAVWTILLLAYAFTASVLPVWKLLQARDFLNSLLLYLGLAASYAGLLIWQPEFAAPMYRPNPEGAPSLYPFTFIIIACGAASGFHALVSSGTTSKQINKETDARFIGYGGMLGESLLGLLAVLATTAGVVGAGGLSAAEVWNNQYANWGVIQGLGTQVGVFITGAAQFIERLGIVDARAATAFIAMVVVSFALTTLDSGTRLLRYNISEMGETLKIQILGDRYVSSLLAVFIIAFFAFYTIDGRPAGLALWRLFGTTNQMLASLALLVVSLYLYQRGRNPWFTVVPMVFMAVSTIFAMLSNLQDFWAQWDEGGSLLFMVALALLVLAVWLMIEAVVAVQRFRGREPIDTMEVIFEQAAKR